MKYFCVLLIICTGFPFCCSAQKTQESNESFNTWTSRIGIGIQKSPYVELGITRLFITNDGLDGGSNAFYAAVEINRRQDSAEPMFYGFKGGFETSWMLFMAAVELKYASDFNNQEVFVITPKGGLTLFGVVNLLYGYNHPKDLNFEGIGKHQFSLVFNINKKILTE
jgi:hypothetical protein